MRVRFDARRCDRCGDCATVCPERQIIDFDAMKASGFIDAGECTNCARCLEVCPREAYHFGLRFGKGAAAQIQEGDHHARRSAA